MVIKILEWGYNNVSEGPKDRGAHVLGFATQCTSINLLNLVPDTSLLTGRGLEHMQRDLEQSDLEFLNVECGAINPSQISYLGQVLEAVNWSALKSLVLFGNNSDGWIDLWAKYGSVMDLMPFEVQLLSINIIGSSGQTQRLLAL